MKVLNLYAGIGGNRKLWTDVEVTAIENNESIAAIYQDFFPDDKVIVTDAHQYLLEHFKEFDFIWSSPPCPTHSRLRFTAYSQDLCKAEYPDMKLYEEILLVQKYFKGIHIIENVISWYNPLIEPQQVGRHYYWCNFIISPIKEKSRLVNCSGADRSYSKQEKDIGIYIKNFHNYKGSKVKLLNNCVQPEIGLHILECARGNYNYLKQDQIGVFDEHA